MIKLTVKGLNELVRKLQEEERNAVLAMTKAHSNVASEATAKLKRGLSFRAGRSPKDKNYQNSPAGSLPYAHTLRLRDSIGYKILAQGRRVFSEVGSGAGASSVEYAKYLEGRNNDGIRPFLWAVKNDYNAEKINKKFWEYFKPLSGRSGK